MAFVGCEDQDFTSLEKVLPPGDRRLTLMRAFKGPIPRLFSEVLGQIPREFQGLAFNLLKKGYLRIKHKSIPVQHAASRV